MIDKHETEIIGSWEINGGRVVADKNACRIESLIRSELREVSSANDGWTRLYVDPTDGRYWELYYLHGEMHGGGPPSLRVVDEESLRQKYGIVQN